MVELKRGDRILMYHRIGRVRSITNDEHGLPVVVVDWGGRVEMVRKAVVDEQAELVEPLTEPEKRDEILATLAQKRKYWLTEIRAWMVELYRRREREAEVAKGGLGPFVTADDARAYFEGMDDVPPPQILSRNFLGAVFMGKEWKKCGDQESQTPGRHANRIFRWRYQP